LTALDIPRLAAEPQSGPDYAIILFTVNLSWWLMADNPPPADKKGMLTAQKPTTVAISAENTNYSLGFTCIIN
jgi:hypothetical protein